MNKTVQILEFPHLFNFQDPNTFSDFGLSFLFTTIAFRRLRIIGLSFLLSRNTDAIGISIFFWDSVDTVTNIFNIISDYTMLMNIIALWKLNKPNTEKQLFLFCCLFS